MADIDQDCLLFDITTENTVTDEYGDESLDEEHGTLPRPKKPWSLCGAAVYRTKYKKDWESKFPFICHGKVDTIYSFYCKVFQKDISCRHQDVSDVKRHEQSQQLSKVSGKQQ